MNVCDALASSPYRMAYNERLRLRVGPFAPGGALHSNRPPLKPVTRDADVAIREYRPIYYASALRGEKAAVRAQDWLPVLPEETVVDLLGRLDEMASNSPESPASSKGGGRLC